MDIKHKKSTPPESNGSDLRTFFIDLSEEYQSDVEMSKLKLTSNTSLKSNSQQGDSNQKKSKSKENIPSSLNKQSKKSPLRKRKQVVGESNKPPILQPVTRQESKVQSLKSFFENLSVNTPPPKRIDKGTKSKSDTYLVGNDADSRKSNNEEKIDIVDGELNQDDSIVNNRSSSSEPKMAIEKTRSSKNRRSSRRTRKEDSDPEEKKKKRKADDESRPKEKKKSEDESSKKDESKKMQKSKKDKKRKRSEQPKIEESESSTFDSNSLSHNWEINPHEITFDEKIGEGSSCVVYKGTYRGQVVALKKLKDNSKKQIENFTKEFDIISQFRSPYVVFFFGGCKSPVPAMVLGYCPRGSLYDVLRNPDIEINWGVVIKVALNTLKGLDSMHNWKPQIVHRDLKSRNILVEDDWQTKLCDFGESRYATLSNVETLCKIRGTYAYIAPEIYFGQQFTVKSDVYALGIILWELCTRCTKGVYEAPYSEYKSLTYDFQIIVQASKKGIRPSLNSKIPTSISNVIMRCWDHEPQNRPDARALLKYFEDINAFPNHPEKWMEISNFIEWPPSGGAGIPGQPPIVI